MTCEEFMLLMVLIAAEQAGYVSSHRERVFGAQFVRVYTFWGGSMQELMPDGSIRSMGHKDAVCYEEGEWDFVC